MPGSIRPTWSRSACSQARRQLRTSAGIEEGSLRRAAQHVFVGVGSGIAGVVYGTIVAMATLAAAYPTVKDPWKLDLIVLNTSVVLWIAHVYSHGLAESLERRRRLDIPELRGIVFRELGILLATLPPTVMLVLGAAEVLKEDNAVWLAFAVGLVTLGAQGFRYARVEKLEPGATVVAVGLNLALGLLVVALKVSVSH